jgi:hypothetical protein
MQDEKMTESEMRAMDDMARTVLCKAAPATVLDAPSTEVEVVSQPKYPAPFREGVTVKIGQTVFIVQTVRRNRLVLVPVGHVD